MRWIVEEIDCSKDLKDFEKLNKNEQHFVKRVLGFFAGSDGIINENLVINFASEVQLPEAKAFYSEQMANETCHSETYCRLIETYITDPVEKLEILRSITTQPYINKKAKWALKWLDKSASFASRLFAYAIVEGVFFSGAFCAIFYFKQRGLLPGLTLSNEFISRDEGLHTDFACLLYSKLHNKLSVAEAHQLMTEALVIEKQFILDALPCELIGMNSNRMSEYLEFVADRLLVALGYPKVYLSRNPFPWMEKLSLEGKDNFFEKRVSTYALANCGSTPEEMQFSVDADF